MPPSLQPSIFMRSVVSPSILTQAIWFQQSFRMILRSFPSRPAFFYNSMILVVSYKVSYQTAKIILRLYYCFKVWEIHCYIIQLWVSSLGLIVDGSFVQKPFRVWNLLLLSVIQFMLRVIKFIYLVFLMKKAISFSLGKICHLVTFRIWMSRNVPYMKCTFTI